MEKSFFFKVLPIDEWMLLTTTRAPEYTTAALHAFAHILLWDLPDTLSRQRIHIWFADTASCISLEICGEMLAFFSFAFDAPARLGACGRLVCVGLIEKYIHLRCEPGFHG